MMKKFVAIALLLLLALSIFGCGRMGMVDTYDDNYRDNYDNVTPGRTDGTYNPAISGQYDAGTGVRGRGYNVTDPVIVPQAR